MCVIVHTVNCRGLYILYIYISIEQRVGHQQRLLSGEITGTKMSAEVTSGLVQGFYHLVLHNFHYASYTTNRVTADCRFCKTVVLDSEEISLESVSKYIYICIVGTVLSYKRIICDVQYSEPYLLT